MSSREQGQGREQLGTLPPGEVHQERLSDWVSLVTFCPFPRNTLFTIARPPCWKNSPSWAFVLAGLGTGNRWWVFCILFSLCGVLCMELVRYGASHTVKYSLTLVLYAPEPSILTYLSQNDFCLPVYLWCINLLTLTWVNNHSSNCWFFIYLFNYLLFEPHSYGKCGLCLFCPPLVKADGLIFGSLDLYCIPDVLLNSWTTEDSTRWME